MDGELKGKNKQSLRLIASTSAGGGKPMLEENRIQVVRPKIDRESAVYIEGGIAGFIGATILASWFLLLDTLNGRPFYTPTLLGSALFRSNHAAWELQTIGVSLEMTLMYTWVHLLIFIAVGGVASWLLYYAESNANLGFAILLLFVIFVFGFVGVAFLVAEPVLGLLAWPAVLVGNLLAAAGMASYLFYRHRSITILP